MGEPVVGAQPLASLELMVVDQSPAVAVLAAPEPAERALGLV